MRSSISRRSRHRRTFSDRRARRYRRSTVGRRGPRRTFALSRAAAVAALLLVVALTGGHIAQATRELTRGADAGAVTPDEVPAHGAHAWLSGDRTRFDPCSPISYVVGSVRLPENGLPLIQQVLAEVTDISGLTFVYRGLTPEFPDSGYARDLGADIWIGWMTPEDGDVFAGDRGTGVAGRGGHASFGSRADRGFAALKSSGDLTPVSGYEVGTLRHEIGHALGLAHVESESEVMHPGGPMREWGPGDRRGLWLLGPSTGCDRTVPGSDRLTPDPPRQLTGDS